MATEVDLTYLGRLFINQLWSSLTSDSSDFTAPPTLPLLLLRIHCLCCSGDSDGLSHHRPTDSDYTRGQQRVMFKGIHTLATIKGIKGSD